jgi:von Willebrand factor type A domain
MSRRLLCLMALALFAGVGIGAARAQPAAGVQIQSIDHSAYPRIALTFTARDSEGRSIVGLNQSQVQVVERGAVIEEVSFSEQPTPGVGSAISIVFDCAKTLELHMPAGRAAVEWFLDQAGKEEGAKGEILNLYLPIATPVDELLPLGSDRFIEMADRNLLINELRTVAPREGETSLFLALANAIRDTGAAAREQGGGGVVVVVSDGSDQVPNSPTINDLIELAKAENVRVVAFGLGTHADPATPDPRLLLSNLAISTRGGYLPADNTDRGAVAALFAGVAPLTPTSEYHLSYDTSTPRDGKEYQAAVSVRLGTGELLSPAASFKTPAAVVALRPLLVALLEYLLFALPIALLTSIAATVLIFTARHLTSSRQELEIRKLAESPTRPTHKRTPPKR